MPIAESQPVPRRTTASGRGREGFTVVELLVTVAIVGVMAAAIMPSLISARADGRQSDAAQELIRLARRARSHMLETGVAHLLRFTNQLANNGPGLGRVELYSGMTNRCRHTPWLQALEGGGALGIPAALLSGTNVFDMALVNPKGIEGQAPKEGDAGRHVVTLRVSQQPTGVTLQAFAEMYICYEPSGQTYTAGYVTPRLAGTVPALQLQQWPVLFTIARKIGPSAGDARGVDRQVVFPPGGNARVRL